MGARTKEVHEASCVGVSLSQGGSEKQTCTQDFIPCFSSVAALKCYNCFGRDEDCPKSKLEANKDSTIR